LPKLDRDVVDIGGAHGDWSRAARFNLDGCLEHVVALERATT
jgi:hypothetical protein